MAEITLETVKAYADTYKAVPITVELFADVCTPIELLRMLRQAGTPAFLLESVDQQEHWGRYSFLGYKPELTVRAKNGTVELVTGDTCQVVTDTPGQAIRRVLSQYKAPRLQGLPPFIGGFVGYAAYEYIGYVEPHIRFNYDKGDSPSAYDVDLMFFDKVIAFDHYRQKIVLVALVATDNLDVNYKVACAELAALAEQIEGHHIHPVAAPVGGRRKYLDDGGQLQGEFTAEFTRDDYMAGVERLKHHIVEGDIFQAVLSNAQSAPFEGSLLNTYRVLRTTNPSPYMFYMGGENLELAGASPETLVRVQDGRVTTYPIAGTRKRGRNAVDDERIAAGLLKDEKELAEHTMLVDLGRNDVGRVSRFGSVEVTRFKGIEKFSHVIHVCSTVEGDLRDDCDALDALEAMLPAGTLSGAPKVRAIELLADMEGTRRGAYGGAIGYLDVTGNMDMCIGIRMAVLMDGIVTVRAGAGIVADSVPAMEYEETINKAKAVMEAIRIADTLGNKNEINSVQGMSHTIAKTMTKDGEDA